MTNPIITNYLARTERVLLQQIQQAQIPAPTLKEAMLHSAFPGGKRLRPILVYLCGEIANADLDSLDVIAAAIELIHCYSLIHDDLPAMDNDDFRRGRPTCHRAFDEATAILTGDGMQGLASEILLSQLPSTLPLNKVIQITLELIKASGFSGMVSGQSLDLTELNQPSVTETQLLNIHKLKTGALFSACINMALLAGKPSDSTTSSLQHYAEVLGIVFQMQDDYHDRYGNQALLGKNRASDEANHKKTFAQLFTQQELEQLINQYYEKAIKALKPLGDRAYNLIDLTQSLHNRMEK